MAGEPPLSPAGRDAGLDRLGDQAYDVLVIGGGITGAGIALDAAARGLSVALVERGDLAQGTSSRSSNLVHGGLRYLETGMVGLVRESASERERLRRLAPHLIRRERFIFVVPRRAAPMIGTGLWAYDALASFRTARHRRLGAEEVDDVLPPLALDGKQVAWAYDDCRTDDARLVLAVAKTAHRLGADVVTRAEAVELLQAGSRVVGATVRDRLSGSLVDISARWTVSAAGVWADAVRRLVGPLDELLVPSKGCHLVFPADALPVRAAAIVPSAAGDRRRVFLLPGDTDVVVGTTDTVHAGPLDSAIVDDADAAYLCEAVNRAFGTHLGPGDSIGAWSGLRPLVRPGGRLAGDPEALSRRHTVLEEPDGLVTVTGGKLTTFRRMAEDVVDHLAAALGRGGRVRPTRRLRLGLLGTVEDAVSSTRRVCALADVDPDLAESLVARHGDDAPALVARAAGRGETGLLVPGLDYLAGEARWAIEEEAALSVEDVLSRRLRVSRQDRAGGGAAVEMVAGMLAEHLGWSKAEAGASAAAYHEAVAAERGPVPYGGRASRSSDAGRGAGGGTPRA
jgi:glycerol-3-phosphate dehydrogenase